MSGRLIALYGVNNLGKSTQLDRLETALTERGEAVVRRKYANYESLTGKIINQILREGREASQLELQTMMALNIAQDQPWLTAQLDGGTSVLLEDYWGTTIAWSLGHGLPEDWIRAAVAGLRNPDAAILLHGRRFTESKEAGHIHESNDSLTERVQKFHLQLADEFGWHQVNANQSIDEVHAEIMKIVGPSEVS